MCIARNEAEFLHEKKMVFQLLSKKVVFPKNGKTCFQKHEFGTSIFSVPFRANPCNLFGFPLIFLVFPLESVSWILAPGCPKIGFCETCSAEPFKKWFSLVFNHAHAKIRIFHKCYQCMIEFILQVAIRVCPWITGTFMHMYGTSCCL